MALDAQAALLPYALVFFAVGLAMFAWASSHAANGELMILSLAVFAINWGVFYALASTVRRKTELAADPVRRTRIHIMGALLWAAAIGQIAIFATGAGPAREALLILSAAGAMACYFFLAPLLPALLLVGPLVAAGPIIALFLFPETRDTGIFTAGALALSMALSLVVNRIVERQFALTYERDELAQSHARAKKLAEELAQSKSALMETLGSEVRNGLVGVTHVLAAAAGVSSRKAPSRDQLNAALGASRDLVEVLNATLDVESADAGRLKVRNEPIDLAQLARDTVYLFQPQAGAAGLELAVFVEPGLEKGAAMGDPMRARQVLSNLIGNALKYTPRGRVEVRVRREKDLACVEVADTGPGMTHSELDDAFQPFTRIERTSAGANGAGLGLPLSRALARLMGGAVHGRSAPGAGSCFQLELPYDEKARARPAPPSGVKPELRGAHVILSLDDRLSGANLRAILETLGHQVVQAQGGKRTVELLEMCPIDLVIAGAPDVVAQVKAADPTIPVLALADGEPETASAFRAAGCDDIVRKPLTSASVARCIAALQLTEPGRPASAA